MSEMEVVQEGPAPEVALTARIDWLTNYIKTHRDYEHRQEAITLRSQLRAERRAIIRAAQDAAPATLEIVELIQ